MAACLSSLSPAVSTQLTVSALSQSMLKMKRQLHVNVAICQSASRQRIRRSLSHQSHDQTRDLTIVHSISLLAEFPRLKDLIASFAGLQVDSIWIPANGNRCRGYSSDDAEGSGSNPSVALSTWVITKDVQQCASCNSYFSSSDVNSDSESEASQCSSDECLELQRTDACPECVRDWWSD